MPGRNRASKQKIEKNHVGLALKWSNFGHFRPFIEHILEL